MTNDVTTLDQRLPTTPQELTEYYRKMAEEYASTERRAGHSISIRNGTMSIGDQPVPGNQFAAIILDAVRLNTFYGEAFNPQNILPPRCYAIGRNDAEMAPHPDMNKDLSYFQPQADRCGACPHNEFGSNRTGQGKACSNRRKLAMLIAGTYAPTQTGMQLQPITDPSNYEQAAIVNMSLAPTTLQGWGQYIRDTAANYQRPPFGVITRVYLYPHPKHGKEAVGFETLFPVPDDWSMTILKRVQEAGQELFEGYEPPKKGPQSGGGFHQVQSQAQYAQQPPQGFLPPQGSGFPGGGFQR